MVGFCERGKIPIFQMDDESDEQGLFHGTPMTKPAKMVLQWIGSYGKRPKHRVYQNGIFFDQSNELCDMEYDGYRVLQKKQPSTGNNIDADITPVAPNFNVVLGSAEHYEQKWLFFLKAAIHIIQSTTLNWGTGET